MLQIIEEAFRNAPNADITKPIIVIDIDGTIADNSHRLHLLPTGDGNTTDQWEAFNKACIHDTELEENISLIGYMSYGLVTTVYPDGIQPVLLTGRGAQAELETRHWLTRNGWDLSSYPLIMREADDHRKATVMKAELFKDLKPVLVFDDDLAIVKVAQELGYPAVLVPTKCAAVAAGVAGAGSNQK